MSKKNYTLCLIIVFLITISILNIWSSYFWYNKYINSEFPEQNWNCKISIDINFPNPEQYPYLFQKTKMEINLPCNELMVSNIFQTVGGGR